MGNCDFYFRSDFLGVCMCLPFFYCLEKIISWSLLLLRLFSKTKQTNSLPLFRRIIHMNFQYCSLSYLWCIFFSVFVVIDCIFTIYSAWIVYIYPFIGASVCMWCVFFIIFFLVFTVNSLCLFPISTNIMHIYEYVFPIN